MQVNRPSASTRTSLAVLPPTRTRTVAGGGVVGPVAAGGAGSWKPAPAISTSRLPPVGPVLGVMLLILSGPPAISLHKEKTPASPMGGKATPGLEFFNNP